MATELTRLTHKIAIQLHLVAESCTICSSRSRQPVRQLLDTPSYLFTMRFRTAVRPTLPPNHRRIICWWIFSISALKSSYLLTLSRYFRLLCKTFIIVLIKARHLDCILSRINPVHTLSLYFYKIILLYTPSSPKFEVSWPKLCMHVYIRPINIT
jgi:hypothetical protein